MDKAAVAYAVRPRPVPGEATPGFLMRVAAANGFCSVAQLFTSLRVRKRPAFEELCERLCLTDQERSYLFGALPRQWGLDVVPLGLHISDFNHTCRRWCPACLKEGSVLQGRWSMKLTCACTVHATWLQDICTQCARATRWSAVDQRHCECGAPLAQAITEQASQTALTITRLLCGDRDGAPLRALTGMLPPDVHRLVRYLGLFASQIRPAHPGQIADSHRMPTAQALVVGTADLLDTWPSRLHVLMAALQASAPASPSVRRTFSPLYRVLYEDLSDPCFQFLRDGFENYLREHWWGLVCKRNKLLKRQTISDHPRLSLPQMAAAAGVPQSVVRHMVQAELVLTTTVPLPSGRQSCTLHLSDLARIQAATDSAVSIQQAAKLVALPERRLRELISDGLVTPLISRYMNQHAAAWLIPKSEIDRLHVRPSGPATDTGIAVRDVLKYWRLRDKEGVGLMKAVIAQQLIPQGESINAVPLGMAILNPAETRRWLAACRAVSGQGLSVEHAAQAMGVKQQVAYDLVRLGLLPTEPHGALGRRISAVHLELFRATYVSLADHARTVHRAPRALLRELNVTPVCGPSVDGTRQYFFRRVDLPANPNVPGR